MESRVGNRQQQHPNPTDAQQSQKVFNRDDMGIVDGAPDGNFAASAIIVLQRQRGSRYSVDG